MSHVTASGPVLVCTGPDPALSRKLAAGAAALLPARDALVLSVWSPPRLPFTPIAGEWKVVADPAEEIAEARRQQAEQATQAATEALQAAGWTVRARVLEDERQPWELALDVADDLGAAVIVIASSQDTRAARGSLGRQARALAHRSPRPLLAFPHSWSRLGSGPALFAYDGSEPARHAVATAAGVLVARPARVTTALRRLWAAGEFDATARDAADAVAREGATLLRDAGWEAEPLSLDGDPDEWQATVAAARENDAAVVVTGTRGRAPITATLLGSFAEGVLRHAGRPVLLVPPPHE